MSSTVTYEGGCHCGAVRFRVIVDEHLAFRCNCSVCRKKGFLHLIVPPESFTLIKGEDRLVTYTFNTRTAQHRFCGVCGIHAFYTPRSDPDKVDVNVNCLDGEDVVSLFRVEPFDGQNWDAAIAAYRQR